MIYFFLFQETSKLNNNKHFENLTVAVGIIYKGLYLRDY